MSDLPAPNVVQYRPTPPEALHALYRAGSASVPVAASLRQSAPSVGNQGSLYGSCTSFAGAKFVEAIGNIAGKQTGPLSETWIWARERQLEGTFPQNTGAFPSDTFLVLSLEGVVTEATLPYSPTSPTEPSTAPTDAMFADALQHRVSYPRRIVQRQGAADPLIDFKARIAQGFPVLVGFQVFSNFFGIGQNGLMPMPTGPDVGGHAVVSYEYNAVGAWCQNEWTVGWGDQGWFLMPWAYLADPALVTDLWTADPFDPAVENFPEGRRIGLNWRGVELGHGGVIVAPGHTWCRVDEAALAENSRATFYPDATPPFVGVE